MINKEIRFWSNVDVKTNDLCWNWKKCKLAHGYGQTGIKGIPRLVHRAAWSFINGEIPKGKNIMHKCDNPSCCNPDHLFIGTQHDNLKDMTDKGRRRSNKGQLIGEKNGRSVLTISDIYKIRSSKDINQQSIASLFGIAQSQVSRILRREQWSHV